MSVGALLERGRRASSGAPAIIAGEVTIGYDELLHRVTSTAVALNSRGLGRGQRIGVVSPNDPVALVASFSVMASGATYVPLGAGYSAREIQSTLERFDCSALIYHDSLAPLIESVHDKLDMVAFFRIDGGGVQSEAANCCNDTSFAALSEEALGSAPLPTPALTDIAWLGLTGGTTGTPKGVEISWAAINAFVQKFVGEFPARQPRMLAAPPLTHAAGMLAMPLFARGGTMVVTRGLNPPEFLSLIETEHITEAFLPPTGYYKLLDDPGVRDHDFSSLRTLIYAAAPMSLPRLREAIQVFGPVLTQVYGQTECHSMISVLRAEDHFVDGNIHGEIADDDRLSSCGWPSLGTTIQIRDDTDVPVHRGERGEICVSSDLNMSGYYDDPQQTAEILRDGFIHTGDIGFVDADGCVHIVDRKKDVIITGGFNVYPAEIEALLQKRTDILECAVVGVPDDYWGEEVVAAVQVRDRSTFDGEHVLTELRRELGAVKTPKRVVVFEHLPLSSVGKVMKTDIRALLMGESR